MYVSNLQLKSVKLQICIFLLFCIFLWLSTTTHSKASVDKNCLGGDKVPMALVPPWDLKNGSSLPKCG